MKQKRITSIFLVVLICLMSLGMMAYAEEPLTIAYTDEAPDKIKVNYNGDAIAFDVEPIAENGRTLVPFRAIFEKMGCAVDYFNNEDGATVVTAHRADDSLMLIIGEPKMYFNGEEIALDVPAKIKDNRTLVPVRAISEAFECEVAWSQDTKTVDIDSPAGHFKIENRKAEETIKDEKGNVLVKVVAYYPYIENTYEIPAVDNSNEDHELNASLFIKQAKESAEDAAFMLEQMGTEKFVPYTFELTYETNLNSFGLLSFTSYKYVNMGGAHPSTELTSMNYSSSSEYELPLAEVIDEDALETDLRDWVHDIFSKKLTEIGIEPDDGGVYNVVNEEMGQCGFYLSGKNLTIYFNQGQVAPYALGIISVDIPYDPAIFLVDLRNNDLESYTYSLENDKGYEWKIISFSEDKLDVTQSYEAYPPEKLLSEYYPVGVSTITVKGIKEGNATLVMAHIEEGKDISTATRMCTATFFIDENSRLSLVTESDESEQ